jgi:hypothetical protein
VLSRRPSPGCSSSATSASCSWPPKRSIFIGSSPVRSRRRLGTRRCSTR